MPTRLYLRNVASSLGGAGQLLASINAGQNFFATAVTTTVASGTNIQVTQTAGGQALVWFSDPLRSAVTISGTVTVDVYGFESANTVNAGAGILVQRANNAGTVISAILNDVTVPATINEYTTGTTQKTGTYTPTSTTLAVGDRIRIVLKVRNVGTMGAGTVTNGYNGPGLGNGGDTAVRFTEDFSVDETIEFPFPIIYGSNGHRG